MSRKSVNARKAAAAAATTQDVKSVLAALVAAAAAREAAEATEARKAEEAARKAAMLQSRILTPEEEARAQEAAMRFRANGGLKAIGRQHQERLAQERREAAEEVRREAWLKTPEGRKAQEAWRREEGTIRRAQRGAWMAHIEAEALRLHKEDLLETIQAGERAEKRLLELGRLPSSLLAQKGEEVKGCLQAKEAATRAEEELTKLGH